MWLHQQVSLTSCPTKYLNFVCITESLVHGLHNGESCVLMEMRHDYLSSFLSRPDNTQHLGVVHCCPLLCSEAAWHSWALAGWDAGLGGLVYNTGNGAATMDNLTNEQPCAGWPHIDMDTVGPPRRTCLTALPGPLLPHSSSRLDTGCVLAGHAACPHQSLWARAAPSECSDHHSQPVVRTTGPLFYIYQWLSHKLLNQCMSHYLFPVCTALYCMFWACTALIHWFFLFENVHFAIPSLLLQGFHCTPTPNVHLWVAGQVLVYNAFYSFLFSNCCTARQLFFAWMTARDNVQHSSLFQQCYVTPSSGINCPCLDEWLLATNAMLLHLSLSLLEMTNHRMRGCVINIFH